MWVRVLSPSLSLYIYICILYIIVALLYNNAIRPNDISNIKKKKKTPIQKKQQIIVRYIYLQTTAAAADDDGRPGVRFIINQ